MKTVPAQILALMKSDRIASAFVPVLDFSLTTGDHLRYARYSTDLTYEGEVYSAWPFEATLMSGGKGHSVPTVTLTIQDAVQVLRPHAIATNWFRGCDLTMAVVCVDHLSLDYAWSAATYDILHAAPADRAVALKLGGPNPVKIRFPANRYFADQCPYARGFGEDPRCGYSGSSFSSCTGTLADCELRGRTARFGGFLGLDPDAAKLVLPFSLRGI